MPSRLAGAGTPMWSNCTRRSYCATSAASFELALDELDLETLDALPVHLDDREAKAVVLDLVGRLWRPPELAEDEARRWCGSPPAAARSRTAR